MNLVMYCLFIFMVASAWIYALRWVYMWGQKQKGTAEQAAEGIEKLERMLDNEKGAG